MECEVSVTGGSFFQGMEGVSWEGTMGNNNATSA